MLEGGDLGQWEEEGEEKARSVQLLGFPVSQTGLSQPLCHLTLLQDCRELLCKGPMKSEEIREMCDVSRQAKWDWSQAPVVAFICCLR